MNEKARSRPECSILEVVRLAKEIDGEVTWSGSVRLSS